MEEQKPAKQPEPVRSQSVSQAPVPKERHSRAFSFVSMMFLLTLLAAGVMTYLWYNQKTQNESLQGGVTSARSTESSLRAQIEKLKKQNANLGNAVIDQVANDEPQQTDDEAIKATVIAWSHARKDAASETVSVEIEEKALPFVRVTKNYGKAGSGSTCILKKADTIWVVLICGQQTPDQDIINIWGIPSSILG